MRSATDARPRSGAVTSAAAPRLPLVSYLWFLVYCIFSFVLHLATCIWSIVSRIFNFVSCFFVSCLWSLAPRSQLSQAMRVLSRYPAARRLDPVVPARRGLRRALHFLPELRVRLSAPLQSPRGPRRNGCMSTSVRRSWISCIRSGFVFGFVYGFV